MLRHLLLRSFTVLALLSPVTLQAQSGNTAALATPHQAQHFMVQDHEVVLRKGDKTIALTKNVVLPNGIKINYKSGIVEFPDGRKTALKEGDVVTMGGEIVAGIAVRRASEEPTPATPAVAAAAPAAATAKPVVAAATPATAAVPAAVTRSAVAEKTRVPFTLQPAAPVNGKLRGVVELGASGFNSFIVRMDEKRNWKLEKSEFGNSLVMENMATEDDVRRGLKAYIAQMLDFGVGGRDIHFVVSSGAAKADVTAKIVAALKSLGYVVNTVTPEQEGQLALRCVLPATYTGKAFVADIGSGNTKISWMDGKKPQSAETYGAKYYQTSTSDAEVEADVKAKSQQVPASQRQTCFIIGGVPFEMAKTVRVGKERYTVLDAPAAYSQLPNAKSKAGVNIYQAIANATSCPQFVFDWDANFTIGYLLTLPQ
jgi:Ppx/GppA phosphatase family